MTQELLAQIEEYEKTFASEGWKLFIEDIKERDASLFLGLMNSASKEADLNFAKGRHDVYTYILGVERHMSILKDQISVEVDDV